MTATEGQRLRAQAGADLRRLLKQLRDREGRLDETAAAITEVRASVKYAALVRACHDLAKPDWTSTIRSGSEVDILSLVGVFRVSRPVEPLEPVSESGPVASVTGARPAAAVIDRAPSVGRAAAKNLRTVDVDEVVAAHAALVEEFRRTRDPIDPPGVKNMDMLESAVSRQHTGFGGTAKYKTLPHLAAALFYGIALNHPFHNGNKRTALLSLVWLLDKNRYIITASEADMYEFVLKVVNHGFRPTENLSASELADIEVREMASWITSHMRRVDRQLHPIVWRELKKRLRDVGCEIGEPDKNFIDVRRGDQRLRLAYPGEGREVSKATIRQIWRDLGLDEAGVFDAAEFYGKAAGIDSFIRQYRGVLGRLANV
jgi:death-on-curing family protein